MHILLTRPLNDCKDLILRFKSLGHKVSHLPVIKIKSLNYDEVNFDEFAPSSLDFFIYTFTKTTDWVRYHEIKQDILLNVIKIIESNGAECAFPTSTLHVSSMIDASDKEA